MMKIFVRLFTGLNLGDDLFLRILLERYPEAEFSLPAPEIYKSVFEKYRNLCIIEDEYNKHKRFSYKVQRFVERTFFPSVYIQNVKRKAENLCRAYSQDFDAFVSIGGSIFMQPRKLPVYFDVIYYGMVNKFYQNTFFIGCNFGPFNDPKYRDGFKDVFKEANDVCFREKYSWKLFSELESVRYRPDVVFGLDVPILEKKSRTVGFSIVSARNGVNRKDYVEKYAKLIEFYQGKGYEVFLFSFCEKQGDESTIESIVSLLEEESRVNKVFYDGNMDRFLSIYGSVEKMFCGRFHSMILSMLFDQEIYPIIYSKKMTNVLSDINYQGKVIDIERFPEIHPDIVYDQMENNKYNIKELRKKSKEQFAQLDVFIKQEKK